MIPLAAFIISDLILLIFAVGLIDYILFYKWSACPKCGEKAKWYAWIPATALELTLFALGIYFGVSL